MPGIKEKKKSTKSAKDDVSPEEEAEIERQKVRVMVICLMDKWCVHFKWKCPYEFPVCLIKKQLILTVKFINILAALF